MRRFRNTIRAAFLAVFFAYSTVTPVMADLVGFWNFNDETANDSSNYENHGDIRGLGFSSDTPDTGGSKSLDATAVDVVLVPHSDSLNISDTLTVAHWMKGANGDQTANWNGTMAKIVNEVAGWETQRFSDQSRIDIRIDTTAQNNAVKGNLTGTYDNEWVHVAWTIDTGTWTAYLNGVQNGTGSYDHGDGLANETDLLIGSRQTGWGHFTGLLDEVAIWDHVLSADDIANVFENGIIPTPPPMLNGGGQTYLQDFDEALGLKTGKMPGGWSAVTFEGNGNSIDGLGLTDGFLTVPGDAADGVLGVLNLGGNAERFGPAPDGHIPTWTAELGGANDLFGRDDVIADNASDRALGVSRENNDDAGELNFEIEIADATMRAFVLDWDLEFWGGDPDGAFRSAEGPGMKTEVSVGGTSYHAVTEHLHPGNLFDSDEDGDSDHNATLIDGNLHSIRGLSSGIKEVSDADGAVGNMVQINFNSNWNGATNDDPNGWMSAIDNVRLRALAPGDADANGVVDVTDLLQLLGGQKFNQGVAGVTWEQGDFNADDQFNTGDLLAMLSFLSGTFPSDPYASEAGGSSDAVADIIVNSETGEVTVDLAGHTVSAIIIESASEIFNGSQPQWDTTSQFPSTLPGELGNVLFTSTASGVDELGAVISAEFLGRDKEFYLQDLDLSILIASEGGALTKGNVIVVPEPSTWLLLGLGSLLFVGWRQVATRRSPGKQ